MRSPNTWLIHAITASVDRKFDVRRNGVSANRSRGEKRRDVGPPEAVDRLLGVADEEQPARLDLDLVPLAGPRSSSAAPSSAAMSTWIGSVSWNSSTRSR